MVLLEVEGVSVIIGRHVRTITMCITCNSTTPMVKVVSVWATTAVRTGALSVASRQTTKSLSFSEEYQVSA